MKQEKLYDRIGDWADITIFYNSLSFQMSDSFRVVECLSRPTDIFCIFDYTKVAYPTDNYVCVRDLLSKDVKPVFLKLQTH